MINMHKVAEEMNSHPGLPPDLEFVVNYMDQSIILRRKPKLPMVVVTRRHLEDGYEEVLRKAAISYVTGGRHDFNMDEIVREYHAQQAEQAAAANCRHSSLSGGVAAAAPGVLSNGAGWET